MRRRIETWVLLAGSCLTLACVSDQNPLPTQPAQFSTAAPYPACDSRYVALITSGINALYPSSPNLRQAALSQFSGVVKQCSKNPADARNKAIHLAGFAAQKFLNHQLITTDWGAVSLHIDYLYQYVGLGAPTIPPGAVGPGAIAVVTPGDPPSVVETGDEQAGVSIPTSAISETQTVLLTITPNPTCEPFPNTLGLQEFPPCYNFETFPEVPHFAEDVIVGICTDITGLSAEQAGRLQLAHARRPDRAALALGPRVDAGFLSCNSFVGNLSQAGRTSFLSRLAQQALALFRPQHLHAAAVMPGGLGVPTGSFTVFQAVDPGKLVFTQQPTNTAAGASITPAPAVTVERENGTTITGDPGNVTLAIGTNPSGGTLSGTKTVSTGSSGVATFPGLSINNPGTGYTLFATSGTTAAGAVPQPVTSAPFNITSAATSFDCGGDPGGDQLFRGFYVSGLPGTTLDRVTLHFSSSSAGLYTLSLTARTGTYDGPILGTATASVTLTANDQANVATTFTFPSPAFTPGSTVTFSLALVSGEGVVFYSVPDLGDATCAVVQTNGTTPPLDTFRRQGVHVKIETGLGNPLGT